jgi:hypothetical protein
MRWSVGVFVVLIGVILVAGPACRNIPTSNTDRNRAPETYLTAAPADSIAGGGLERVPHRFRASWSGSDVDGEVVGFYVAVTETTLSASGFPFRLPPPKPSQYRFTTSRDSLFIFSVIEGRGADRQHALYVFAVDNQGKVDPTPAVTHLVARDQNLPEIVFLEAVGRGTIYNLLPGGVGVMPQDFARPLTDATELPLHAPIDTIPSGGWVRFAWRGFDRDFASYITGYLYKLVETEFVRVDTTVTSVEYGRGFGANPNPLPIGLNTFRLRAIDEAGGTTQPDALRQFFVNFSPDTWFAGPDVAVLAPNLMQDSLGWYFPLVPNSTEPLDFPGSPIGADTLVSLPAERPDKSPVTGELLNTFVEMRTLIDRTLRYYIRSQNDTLGYGSFVIVRLGGLDKDSPYAVGGGSPTDTARVYRTGPPNGSPVAFQARIVNKFASGGQDNPPFVTPFPNKNFLDPSNNPVVLYMGQVSSTGRSYLQARAVDGDRTPDIRIGLPIAFVDGAGDAHPLRNKVLTFFTNFRPGLLIFSPVANEVVNPPDNRFEILLRASDPDPDPANPRLSSQYLTMYFRFRARLRTAGDNLAPEEGWQDPFQGVFDPVPAFFPYTQEVKLQIVVPNDFAPGAHTIEVEVADNTDRAQARIVNVEVPFYWRTGP